jgi:hypothetical protein
MNRAEETHMETNQSATSWGAILAGAAAAAALTLVLVSLGSAVGFSSVSPWPSSGVSATTFKIATGLYLVFTAMVASTIGGYISGRLRSKWTGLHTYEVTFRDTAHGFLAWAVATIAGAAFLASAATLLVGGAAKGAAAGAGSSAGRQAGSSSSDYYTALLFRPGTGAPAANGPANPSDAQGAAAPNNAARGGAPARAILAHATANGGTLSDSDRSYLAHLVSARTGLSQVDADKRVSDVMTQAKNDADQARKAAASVSIWLTIAMFVGAFSASLAAIEGGQLRDRRWRGVIGARAYNEARIEP